MTSSAQTPLSTQEYLAQIRERREMRRGGAQTMSQAYQAPETTSSTDDQRSQPPVDVGNDTQANEPVSLQDGTDLFPGVSKPIPEETVFEWTAPSRPFKKRDRQYYTTVGAIVFLISLILFFAGQFLPIAVVISVAFLAYVLSSVPPEVVTNKVTTYGIRVENAIYYWEELGRFWYDDKLSQRVLHIETARFPGRITLLLGQTPEKDMTEILSEVLLQEKPTPTFFDKSAAWIQEKIPLEVTS